MLGLRNQEVRWEKGFFLEFHKKCKLFPVLFVRTNRKKVQTACGRPDVTCDFDIGLIFREKEIEGTKIGGFYANQAFSWPLNVQLNYRFTG